MINLPINQHIFNGEVFVTIERAANLDWVCFPRSNESIWETGGNEAEAVGKLVLRLAAEQTNDNRRNLFGVSR